MREAYGCCHLNKFVERFHSAVTDGLEFRSCSAYRSDRFELETKVLNLKLSWKHLYSVVGHHWVNETLNGINAECK